MLPIQFRLKRRSSFAAAYSRGRSYASDLVVVYVLPNRVGNTRVGFSVSKKLGKSVSRNRVKRLLREAVRQQLERVEQGYDIILVARAAAAGADFERIRGAVRGLLARAGVLRAGEGA